MTEKPAVAVPQVKTPRDLAGLSRCAWLLQAPRRERAAVGGEPQGAARVRAQGAGRKAAHRLRRSGLQCRGGEPAGGAEQTRVAATRSYTDFWQGAGADRTMLSKALPRLPETAAELQAVAQNLGAPASSIHLRQAASETTVKRAALADYRVVYFATHGLVAGEVKGLAEPSLALTLPKQPSETDDGLLTASEVAQLKLNADWVVLSACNTIAGDKPGAEALSGLARAFFYAGARALLVSHWAVESQRRDAAHHLDLRHHEVRSVARPRRGAAPRHAGLHRRHVRSAQRLSGVLGAVRGGGRRGGEVKMLLSRQATQLAMFFSMGTRG